MKKKLIFAVLAALIFSAAADAAITPLFSPSPQVKTAILEQIESAEQTIDIAMYSFSDAAILSAVKTAASHGLQVRLILNQASQDGAKAEDLEAAGVDVRYVTPVMHHKFVIFDGPLQNLTQSESATLLTGSGNWSTSSSSKYDEDLLIFQNEPAFVSSFQQEFNHLWTNAREFGNAKTYDVPALTNGAFRQAVFTSENMIAYLNNGQPTFKAAVEWNEGIAGKTIIEEIAKAEINIQIASAHFRRSDIYDALVAALNRGVQIQIVLDQQEFHSINDDGQPTFYDELLADQGAEVRYKVYSRYWDYRSAKQMHAKYLLVDEKTVVTGSFNWSRNAEISVMENLVRISDRDLSQAYKTNFMQIWSYGSGEFSTLLDSVQQTGNGPCAFNPLSLTGREIKQLHGTYAQGACH